MEELDFLKSHWQKKESFPQIEANEIRNMLHKSSSSIVKWIFIISILEFVFGIAISFVLPEYETKYATEPIVYDALSVFFYVIVCYFIFHFFQSFRRIKSTTDTKSLLESILKSRRHVEYYIRFNIVYFFITLIIMSGFQIHQYWRTSVSQTAANRDITLFIIGMIVSGMLITLLIYLYYKLLYGLLLKKLSKNYKELTALNEE